jgi:sugar phosphate isomerase/epimerase
MPAVHAASFTDARNNLKALLDAAHDGRTATVRRDRDRLAVVDAARLRFVLSRLVPTPQAVAEGGGWSIMLDGVPVAADGASFAEAVEDFLAALREYAEDWSARLRLAPNHQDNWGIVQLVDLSSDAELEAWATGNPTRQVG